MVICTYFLTNSCRFGSKCNNEHLDLGAMVTNEVDVTIKGNQWPLSCFGPFKERTCIPNFIEDHSFEEIRMMYLEAKLQNNIPAHQMQLAQMINDAKTKMQWLTTKNRDVLTVLVDLYNQQESSAKPAGLTSNPFASVGAGSNSTQASNIFGGATSGNAFGSSFGANTSISAPVTTSGLFGQATPSSGNIFGSAASSTGGNIFAKAGQTQSPSNMFGQPAQPTNSIFGGSAVLGGGMFGSVQQPTSTSLFGSVTAPPNASVGANIFANAAQTPSAFGQAASSGAFGGGNIFGNTAVSATPATGFGAVAAQPQQSTGLFNSISFGSSQSTSAFGQFGGPAPNTSSQNLFLPAPSATASPFGASIGSTNAFGAAASQPSLPVQQSTTMYSKMEDITPEHLAAFNADQFQLGRIPTVPPPKELCH